MELSELALLATEVEAVVLAISVRREGISCPNLAPLVDVESTISDTAVIVGGTNGNQERILVDR